MRFSDSVDLKSWNSAFPSATDSPAKHVRALTICCLKDRYSEVLDESLFEQFRMFNRVGKLCLNSLNLPTSPFLKHIFTQLRPVVKYLELHSLPSTDPNDLLDFISSFPHLEDLAITGTSCWLHTAKRDSTRPKSSPPFRGSLRLVDFDDPNGDFISALLALPNGVSFRSIELDVHQIEDYSPIGCLISSCATTLEVLKLKNSFAGMSGIPALFTSISEHFLLGGLNLTTDIVNLKHNHVLRHLTLTLAASKSFSYTWIEGLLSSISSPHASEIVLQFIIPSKPLPSNQFRLSDWECLDRVLTRVVEHGVAKRLVLQVFNDPLDVNGNPVALVESVMEKVNRNDCAAVPGALLTHS